MNNKDTFQKLLTRYSSGNCSDAEVRELLQLIKENPEYYELLDTHINHDWWIQVLSIDTRDQMEDDHKNAKRGSRIIRRWSIAAGFLLLIAAGLFWWLSTRTGTIEYMTGYGERKTIELPDGSQVELNANSHLSWNKNWKRIGVRKVRLEGEAYFDVVKSEAHQFQVNTGEVMVKVLGTSFNVSNRRGETEVFLKEGKVELAFSEQQELLMVPGEKVEYISETKKINKKVEQNLYTAAAWKTGVISFQKTPLKEILPELADIYGVRLICRDSSLLEKVMDVGVPYMDWEATKTSLELSMKVKIDEKDGNYIIESKE